MKKYLLTILPLSLILLIFSCTGKQEQKATRWSEEKANAWYAELPWLRGCDYIPSSAINQIEMWSGDTYDEAQIEKEMEWAEDLGFNTMRVYLSSVVWQNDPEGIKSRMDNFLTKANNHGIRPLFVFMDDCWNAESHYGKQPEPKPGVHNSGWVRDPSDSLRADTVAMFASLEPYVKDILTYFAKDERILLWDMYNEPGNSEYFEKSLPLLKKTFEWAREVNPSQPITAGIWNLNRKFDALNAFQLQNSDVISYHNYSTCKNHKTEIEYLRVFNRPLVCTEYMNRRDSSFFQTVMPMLKAEKVVAINWGFVSGKTNTIFAWDQPMPDVKEPPVWFHDIYRQDGTPFSQEEIDTIKSLTGKQ